MIRKLAEAVLNGSARHSDIISLAQLVMLSDVDVAMAIEAARAIRRGDEHDDVELVARIATADISDWLDSEVEEEQQAAWYIVGARREGLP